MHLPSTVSSFPYKIDTIDLDSFPFDDVYSAFLQSCIQTKLADDDIHDYSPDLDESSLSLLDVDTNCSALQPALSADSVHIDLLPESPLLTDDELLVLSINELSPAQ